MQTSRMIVVVAAPLFLVQPWTGSAHAQDRPAKQKERPAQPGQRAQGDAQLAPGEAGQAGIEPKAREILQRTSASMRQMSAFGFSAAHETDVVLEGGQKIQLGAESDVIVERPSRVRSERRGELAQVTLYYDGSNVTIYDPETRFYATAKAPPTIDDTVDFLRERLNMEVPAGDLLYSDLYEALTEDVVSGRYVGVAEVRGVRTHHLAFRGSEVDWQIWVEDSPRALPRKYVITSKTVEGSPQFTVELYDWQFGEQIPNDAFTFVPPTGAERISFLGLDDDTRPKPRTKR